MAKKNIKDTAIIKSHKIIIGLGNSRHISELSIGIYKDITYIDGIPESPKLSNKQLATLMIFDGFLDYRPGIIFSMTGIWYVTNVNQTSPPWVELVIK